MSAPQFRRRAAAVVGAVLALGGTAGSALVNAIGPIRQIVQGAADAPRRYLVIVPGAAANPGAPAQIQTK